MEASEPRNRVCRIPRIGGRQVVEIIIDEEVRSCTAATRAKPETADPVSKHNYIRLGHPDFEMLRRCCVLGNPAQFLSSQRPVYGRQVLNASSALDAPLLCWCEELEYLRKCDGSDYAEAVEHRLEDKNAKQWTQQALDSGWPTASCCRAEQLAHPIVSRWTHAQLQLSTHRVDGRLLLVAQGESTALVRACGAALSARGEDWLADQAWDATWHRDADRDTRLSRPAGWLYDEEARQSSDAITRPQKLPTAERIADLTPKGKVSTKKVANKKQRELASVDDGEELQAGNMVELTSVLRAFINQLAFDAVQAVDDDTDEEKPPREWNPDDDEPLQKVVRSYAQKWLPPPLPGELGGHGCVDEQQADLTGARISDEAIAQYTQDYSSNVEKRIILVVSELGTAGILRQLEDFVVTATSQSKKFRAPPATAAETIQETVWDDPTDPDRLLQAQQATVVVNEGVPPSHRELCAGKHAELQAAVAGLLKAEGIMLSKNDMTTTCDRVLYNLTGTPAENLLAAKGASPKLYQPHFVLMCAGINADPSWRPGCENQPQPQLRVLTLAFVGEARATKKKQRETNKSTPFLFRMVSPNLIPTQDAEEGSDYTIKTGMLRKLGGRRKKNKWEANEFKLTQNGLSWSWPGGRNSLRSNEMVVAKATLDTAEVRMQLMQHIHWCLILCIAAVFDWIA